jgi:uncharacterized protein (DUF983 family)
MLRMVPLPIHRWGGTALTEPTAFQVALGGLCPRCGAKTLFAGFARFAPACRACGLDLSAFNVGDGPAAFLTLGIGGLVTALAIALELSASPPWWLHVLIWLPVTIALVLGSLRFSKGALLALEYRHRAREGRIAGDGR